MLTLAFCVHYWVYDAPYWGDGSLVKVIAYSFQVYEEAKPGGWFYIVSVFWSLTEFFYFRVVVSYCFLLLKEYFFFFQLS